MKEKVLLLILSFLVAGITIEGALRLLAHFRAVGAKKEQIVVVGENGLKKHAPNQDVFFYNQESNRKNHLITNSEGFIGIDRAPTVPTGTKRLAFLGDSFVEAVQVDYDKNFVSLVGNALSQEPFVSSTAYEVMNFGVQNQGPVEELLDYRAFVKKYHPDVVVVSVYLGNDLADSRPFMERKTEILGAVTTTFPLTETEIGRQFDSADEHVTLKQRILNLEIVKMVLQICKNNRFLFKLLVETHVFKNPFKDSGGAVNRPFNEIWLYADEHSEKHREVIDFAGEILKELGQEVRANGGQLVVMLIPSNWQVDDRYTKLLDVFSYPLDLQLPNRMLETAIGTGVPVLDLSKPLSSAINERHEQVFLLDRGHFTERGHVIVASELYVFLKKNHITLGL